MKKRIVRAIAICVFRDGDRILAGEGYDSIKRETFYRPLGGTIEFGEEAVETVRREIREEIVAETRDLRFLGALENIFVHEGQAGHEIVLVYDGKLSDKSLYAQAVIEADELGTPFKAVWKKLSEFGPHGSPLYPDGLMRLLAAETLP